MRHTKKFLLFFLLLFWQFSIFAKNNGIGNSGSDCFLCSTMQCLSHLDPLVLFFENNPDARKDGFQKEFYDFVSLVRTGKNSLPSGVTSEFRKYLCDNKIIQADMRNGHQDAFEALRNILIELEKQYTEEFKKKILCNIKKNTQSTCSKCTFSSDNSITSYYEKYIKVDIKKFDKNENANFFKNLEECLNNFLVESSIGDCTKCKSIDSLITIREKKLSNFPEILIIVLTRFEADWSTGKEKKKKISNPVSFPPILSLKPEWLVEEQRKNPPNYNLIGFVQHSGDLNGGHYTAYAQDQERKWYFYNDSSVSDAKNIQEILSTGKDESFSPYILFYQKEAGPKKPPIIKKEKSVQEFMGGGSGYWIPLDTLMDGKDCGIKIFKKDVDYDAEIEYEIWKKIKSNHENFVKLVGKENLPKEWEDLPVSEFMYNKIEDTFSNELKEEINLKINLAKMQFCCDLEEQPKWLLMQDFKNAAKNTYKFKVLSFVNLESESETLKEIKKFATENNIIVSTLIAQIAKSFLLMFFLGVTIEDCDLFLLSENKGSAKIKFIDFGDCSIFNEIEEKKAFSLFEGKYKTPDDDEALIAAKYALYRSINKNPISKEEILEIPKIDLSKAKDETFKTLLENFKKLPADIGSHLKYNSAISNKIGGPFSMLNWLKKEKDFEKFNIEKIVQNLYEKIIKTKSLSKFSNFLNKTKYEKMLYICLGVKKSKLPPKIKKVATKQSNHQPPPSTKKNLGLKNVSNTDCFMSSVIQVLRHTKPFMQFLENNKDFRKASENNRIPYETYRLFKMLQGEYYKEKYEDFLSNSKTGLQWKPNIEYKPTKNAIGIFRNFITSALMTNNKNLQNLATGAGEASQFFKNFLSVFITNNPYANNINLLSPLTNIFKIGTISFANNNYKPEENNPKVLLQNQGHNSGSYNLFIFNEKKDKDLMGCLKSFFEIKKEKKIKAIDISRKYILSLPQVLAIELFSAVAVSIPLCLTIDKNWLIPIKDITHKDVPYNLFSVIYVQEEIEGNQRKHFITLAKDNDKWYEYDDENVTEITPKDGLEDYTKEDKINKKKIYPYMLFYELDQNSNAFVEKFNYDALSKISQTLEIQYTKSTQDPLQTALALLKAKLLSLAKTLKN